MTSAQDLYWDYECGGRGGTQVPRPALLRGNLRAYTWALTSIPDVPTSKNPAWILCLKCPVVSVTQGISYIAFTPT